MAFLRDVGFDLITLHHLVELGAFINMDRHLFVVVVLDGI